MRTTRKRVPVPFLFRADDALGANGTLIARVYGNEVEGVFTRAAVGRYATDRGVAVAPHSGPRLGSAYGTHALLLDAAVTNLVTYSEDFSNGAWTTANVTANAATIGGVSMGLFTDASGASVTASAFQTVTFTGNGTKTVTAFVYAGTSPSASLQLFDSTAGAIRGTLDLAFTNGVPTATFDTGGGATGTALAVEDCGGGLYRVGFTANGVLAANTNGVYLYGTDNSTGSATGTCYMGGVQAVNAVYPGPYTKTTTSAANTVESCYFPFTLAPQEMTVYVRGLELGTALGATDRALFGIGGASDAAFFVDGRNGGAGYASFHRRGSDVSSVVSNAVTYGATVEVRAVLSATGTTTCGVTVGGGAEVVGSTSAANAPASSWVANRFYLGERNGTAGNFAFTHACVQLGTKTLAEMRALAEVG